jgi:hypothetical protein
MTGHDGIGIHTMAGTFVGTDHMFHDGGWSGTESHIGVAGSGFAKQWTPWNRQADAMLDGNPRWLSIENADFGESFPPASTASDTSPPLTDAQIDRIVALCVYWCDVTNHQQCPPTWTCHKVGIPPVFVTSSCARGIAGHRAGIDPWRPDNCPHWSKFGGKICPRKVRLDQVRDRIVPRVAAALGHHPEENDDVPHFHTVRRTGKPTLLVTSTGLRAEFAPSDAAGLQALSTKLEGAGFDHAKSVTCDSDQQYAVLTAPAPLTEADRLRLIDGVWAAVNVTEPGTARRPNPGIAVADLSKIVADATGAS